MATRSDEGVGLLGGPEGTAYRQDLSDDDFKRTCLQEIIQPALHSEVTKMKSAEQARRKTECRRRMRQAATEEYFSAEQVAANGVRHRIRTAPLRRDHRAHAAEREEDREGLAEREPLVLEEGQ